MRKLTLEYQLGYYIGEYIVCRYLPTLNIDALKTRNVIDVSPEEFKEHKKLDESWFNKVFNKEIDSTEEWNNLRSFQKEMVKKYIPETLDCYVENFKVDNINDLKEGISESLWNSDLSHYSTNVDDIIIEEIPEDFADFYIRRQIKLRRVDNE